MHFTDISCERVHNTLYFHEGSRQQIDENMYIFSEHGGAICYSGSMTAGPVETVTTDAKCCPKSWCEARKSIKRTRCKFPSIGSIFRSFSSGTRSRGGSGVHSVNVEISGIYVVSVSVGFVTEGQISQSSTVVTAQGINERNVPLCKI